MDKARLSVLREVRGLVKEDLVSSLADEIQFWSHQLSEHATLLHSALSHPELKERAGQQSDDWEEFRQGLGDRDVSVVLKDAYAMCDQLRALKTEIIDRQMRGEWLGWFYPGLVDHMRKELDYFVAVVSDELSDSQGVAQWIGFMADHIGFISGLIDPVHFSLQEQCRAYYKKLLEKAREAENKTTEKTAQEALAIAQEFGQWTRSNGVGSKRVRSGVSPLFASHMKREGERFGDVIARVLDM